MITEKSTLVFSEKNIHQQPITGISASKQNDNLFLTISEDSTMRLYDLRLQSSVKLFNLGKVEDSQTANCLLSDTQVYGARNNEIQLFDIRQDIIVKACTLKSENDSEINQITFDSQQQLISANFDSGCTSIFDRQLNVKSTLKEGHENICFSGDFIQDEGEQLYVSTGFDYKIILWDYQYKHQIEEQPILQQASQAKILFKFDLSTIHLQYAPLTVSPPVIYSATSKDNSILISTETGQVYCFKVQQLKRKKNKKPPIPEFVIDAHKSKVMRTTYLNDKIVTISNDQTFAIWNQSVQVLRAKIKDKPNWIESIGNNTVLVSDISNKLSIFEIV
ncbi:unnamed protein product (macronuclear) [Paramecium tetraurelia]|uniref:Uncharacterized protein n=1 Tax=Paramecium tetraurelia TaxID=5888 RepID=A0BGW5_PARTE|nr:uncharacterized protein GSPATT00028817001 [Paramecium tetraurelia]CAK57782.1 unnamed protein product [Paramecium tetraurelia]|eukprot:XP_001425180.1 hypothetical protein (macronuclear) [Paramecium tetraurelia strain d4-2]